MELARTRVREREKPKKYKTKKEQVISKEVVQKVGRSNLWDERKSFGVLRQVLKSGGDADDRVKHWGGDDGSGGDCDDYGGRGDDVGG